MFEAPTLQTLADYNVWAALPALALVFGTMIVLLVDIFLPEERKHWTPILAISGVSASFIMTLLTYNANGAFTEGQSVFNGMFVADAFTGFLNLVILGSAFLSILLSTDYLRRTNTNHGEYYSLLLLSTAGAMFMAGANDLIVVFIALELLSIPLYVLAAFRTTSGAGDTAALRSEEAGVKYFILGAFSSAFFVYGAALVYGATGTTNLNEIFAAISTILAPESAAAGKFFMLGGAALMLVGLGFKVAAVPFHMWTPDVYEGSPTPVTAFMSVVAKVGGFGSLLRIMIVGLATFTLTAEDAAAWQPTVQLITALTLIVGNLLALSQFNVKRMLAYSSIAHAGYILMAVASVGSINMVPGIGDAAAQAGIVYLMTYMFTNIGAFAVVLAVEKADGSGVDLEDFVGLSQSKPWLAAAMAIFMLSLTGIPLTAGFLGKWLVFGVAVQAGLIPLAIIGVLTSVISAFYYVRVIVNMYLRDSEEGEEIAAEGATTPVRYAIYASMVGVLIVGIAVPLVMNLVEMVQLV